MTYRVSYRIEPFDRNNLPLMTFPTKGEAVTFILEEMDDLAETHDGNGCGSLRSEVIAEVISVRYVIEQV